MARVVGEEAQAVVQVAAGEVQAVVQVVAGEVQAVDPVVDRVVDRVEAAPDSVAQDRARTLASQRGGGTKTAAPRTLAALQRQADFEYRPCGGAQRAILAI